MTESIAKKFLLADDDRDDREMFSEALASLDPKIVCQGVEDGRQALSLLSNSENFPSIIFIDINMPVMNGWELLKKLKADNNYVNIPVIVYSTSSGAKDRETAQDLGAACFVTKPDNFKLMTGMLEIVINSLDNDRVKEMCVQIRKALHQ